MKLEITIKQIDDEGYLCIKLADLTLLKRSKAFKPPTIEEVTEYCKAQQNGINPVTWWNFYDGKNWMVGKNKMVRWKSTMATWKKDEPESKGTNLNAGQVKVFEPRKESETATTMPESMRKRMLNIGKE